MLLYFRVNCFWAGDLGYIENNQFWRNRCEIPPGQYKTCSISFTYCWYIIEPIAKDVALIILSLINLHVYMFFSQVFVFIIITGADYET